MMSFDNQVTGILPLIGRHTDSVELIKRENDVFRLVSGTERFYLKAYTKNWYGSDPATTGFHVMHESVAWAILAQHGLAVPTVMYTAPDCENPISRPFLLTRELEGRPFTDWLLEADRETLYILLTMVGDYLRQMHEITFQFPGYLGTLNGPPEHPDPAGWQHRCWSAKARETEAWKQLQADEAYVTDATRTETQQACSQISSRLLKAYQPPHFTHGDCHAHQFFLVWNEAGWQITGVVDMEVSSAGDSGEDLLKISLELAQRLDHKTHWWEALFEGYGIVPDLEAFRLRLLGVAPVEYGFLGMWIQTTNREAVLQRLLHAKDWTSLLEPIV